MVASRGDAAATWIFCGSKSRRRRDSAVDRLRQQVAATPRLRHGYSAETGARLRFPATRLFARALTRSEAAALRAAGADEVVVEFDELAKSAPALLEATWAPRDGLVLSDGERKSLGLRAAERGAADRDAPAS